MMERRRSPSSNARLCSTTPSRTSKPDVQAPLLPLDVVAAGDREAGALRLGDVDGLLRGAQRAGELRVGVVAVLGRNRHGADVQHLVHASCSTCPRRRRDRRRVRPGAVLGEVLHEGQAAQDPAALLLRVLEDAGGQRGHADLADVQVPRLARAASHRGSASRISSTTSNSSSRTPGARRSRRCPARRRTSPRRWTPRRSRRWARPRRRRARRPGTGGPRFPPQLPWRVHQAQVGDALVSPSRPRSAQDALDCRDFGGAGQAVRAVRGAGVSLSRLHGGFRSGDPGGS